MQPGLEPLEVLREGHGSSVKSRGVEGGSLYHKMWRAGDHNPFQGGPVSIQLAGGRTASTDTWRGFLTSSMNNRSLIYAINSPRIRYGVDGLSAIPRFCSCRRSRSRKVVPTCVSEKIENFGAPQGLGFG